MLQGVFFFLLFFSLINIRYKERIFFRLTLFSNHEHEGAGIFNLACILYFSRYEQLWVQMRIRGFTGPPSFRPNLLSICGIKYLTPPALLFSSHELILF